MNTFAKHVIEYTCFTYAIPVFEHENIEYILTLCKCYNGGFGDFISLFNVRTVCETMAVKRKMLANFLIHGKN